MNSLNIRKNDNVKIISGKDKGKTGRVLRVIPAKGRLLVEHVGMIKKHMKESAKVKAGISSQEAAIDISNVQLICKTCGPVRAGHDHDGNRVCKKCDAIL